MKHVLLLLLLLLLLLMLLVVALTQSFKLLQQLLVLRQQNLSSVTHTAKQHDSNMTAVQLCIEGWYLATTSILVGDDAQQFRLRYAN